VPYFDTHCHLNHDSFLVDFEQVISRALLVGVEYFLIPGWDLESSKVAVKLAESNSHFLAAVGFHPTEWQKADQKSVEEISQLALNPNVVAIGEIGLDFHHDTEHIEQQSELLFKMFSIAENVNKPVLIHSRESISELLVLLQKWKNNNWSGIIHSYEGDLETAQILIGMGFKLGVGGPLTYKNSKLKHEVFSSIPLNSIVLETDSPYLPPVPFRGERNEPGYLEKVGIKLIELRPLDQKVLLESIFQNSYKMFNKGN
jgi:TatD DNase family protein